MLDLALIRSDPDAVRTALARRGEDEALLETVLARDEAWRALQTQADELRAERNRAAEAIGEAKKAGRDAAAEIAAAGELRARLDGVEEQLRSARAELDAALLALPNLRARERRRGLTEEDGEIVRTVGAPLDLGGAEPRDHLELGRADGSTWSAARARRARASATCSATSCGCTWRPSQYALDAARRQGLHARHAAGAGARGGARRHGLLPGRPRAGLRASSDDELYLVGTSEVSLAALHMGEILAEDDLPLRYCGLSSCFRREAGAAGKDTRGIFRTHQFDKVEMFSFCHPDDSWEEHERLLAIEEEIAQALGLPLPGASTSRPATSARRPPRSTTSRSGCPARAASAS